MRKTFSGFIFMFFLSLVFIVGSISLLANSDVDVIITIPAPAIPPPTLSLSIDKNEIILGENAQLSWSSANASSCSGSGSWAGAKSLSGIENLTPISTGIKSFTLSCLGDGGSITQSVNLLVNPVPEPISEETPPVVVPPAPPITPPSTPGFPAATLPPAYRDTLFRLVIYSQKNRVLADGVDYTNIVGQVRDDSENLVSGINVRLVSNYSTDIISPNISVSDQNGFVFFTIKSSQPHTSTIEAALAYIEANYSSNSIAIVFEPIAVIDEEDKIVENIIGALSDFRKDEGVKSVTQKAVAPILAATAAIVSYLVLVSLFKSLGDLLPFINYLITSILQFFGIRRRLRRWGIVYDTGTKEPIDLAIVRLFDKKLGRVLQTSVTDKSGRFGFDNVSGELYLTVSKPFYKFPSKFLKGLRKDGKYTLLYFGKSFRSSVKQFISFSVPLDPIDLKKKKRGFTEKVRAALDLVSTPALIIGIAISVLVVWINPVLFNKIILVLYAVLLILKKLLLSPPLRPVGFVFDANKNKPISGISIKVFDAKYNKMLDTKITDKDGKFNLLLPTGSYYLRVGSYNYGFAGKSKATEKDYIGGVIDIKEGTTPKIRIPLIKI